MLIDTLNQLRDTFTNLHTTKENLFWSVKMGISADMEKDRQALVAADIAMNRFREDAELLKKLRTLATSPEAKNAPLRQRHILEGWIRMLAASAIESAEAKKLSEQIVEMEAALNKARYAMELGFVNPDTKQVERATQVKLGLMVRTDPVEARRKAAWEGLRSIETHVLNHGFIDLVKARNKFGRLLGYEDYYDWKTTVVEGMRKRALFALLDDLAARTKARAEDQLAKFKAEKGANAVEPWNFGFMRSGQLLKEIDPYFRFADSLDQWGRSFAAMNIKFRGATLTLDLVDRKGKYENGFMHGPEVAYFHDGAWKPARINFTANAVPGMVSSGLRAAQTFFHEGGHAAHFANVISDAPCFAHEFAPTSVAYAETQSMFLDSLLSDAAWRRRYATNADGNPMPMELIEKAIREEQPYLAWEVRAGLLSVPFAERALYEIPDAELTPERVLATFRRVEQELTGLSASARPTLAVPHLLAGESSAYYHGYVMAQMAVSQTRAFFLNRDGHICDNPRIGPDLADHYWAPGNAVSFDDTLRSLTGKGLSADALVEDCTRPVDEALKRARQGVAKLERIPELKKPVDLGARVRVVHGTATICDTASQSFTDACHAFSAWIGNLEKSATP